MLPPESDQLLGAPPGALGRFAGLDDSLPLGVLLELEAVVGGRLSLGEVDLADEPLTLQLRKAHVRATRSGVVLRHAGEDLSSVVAVLHELHGEAVGAGLGTHVVRFPDEPFDLLRGGETVHGLLHEDLLEARSRVLGELDVSVVRRLTQNGEPALRGLAVDVAPVELATGDEREGGEEGDDCEAHVLPPEWVGKELLL